MDDTRSALMEVSVGSWPDWVIAISTSLAFLIAAITYARSVRSSREAQARTVYASLTDTSNHEPGEMLELLASGAGIGGGEGYTIVPDPSGAKKANMMALAPLIRTTVRIHNGSNELIGPVKLMLVNAGTGKLFDRVSMIIGPVEPHSDKLVDLCLINDVAPGFPSITPTIWFRDSSNRWWRRHQYEPIERIHNDPNNMADTDAEREQRARVVEQRGLGALPPEPRVALKVRLWRLWRRLRGKNPLP